MRFGPFTMSSLNSVTDELQKRGIAFDVHDDKAMLAEQEAAWKAQPPASARRGMQYDPSFLFVEIEDRVWAERGTELAALGLEAEAEEPDFDQEDYVCTECGKVVANSPGVCPVHRRELITWSAHVEAKRAGAAPIAALQPRGFPRWMAVAILGLIALLLLARFGGQALRIFN